MFFCTVLLAFYGQQRIGLIETSLFRKKAVFWLFYVKVTLVLCHLCPTSFPNAPYRLRLGNNESRGHQPFLDQGLLSDYRPWQGYTSSNLGAICDKQTGTSASTFSLDMYFVFISHIYGGVLQIKKSTPILLS